MCIRKRIIDDPRYAHLRGRKDVAMLSTGRANRKVPVTNVKPDLDTIRKRVLGATSAYECS